jgi:predicted membrane channel-forming protein YqfA (hemolysin III family)
MEGKEEEESPKERIDRELIELLNELRVALPGVQVLFAFLLTVPFSAGFGSLSQTQRSWYFASFLATAAAIVALMAPTTYHRIQFRQGDKERLLRTANHLAIAGTVFLSLAIGGTVFVVADVLHPTSTAAIVASSVFAVMTWLWFGLPLVRRFTDRR